jgi:uncharacterized membrane protein
MNNSLKPKTNIVFCLVWLSVVVASWLFVRPFETRLVLVLLGLGVLAGLMQAQALSEAKAMLKASETLMDVRRAMMRSSFGKASIWLLWSTGAGLAIWNFHRSSVAGAISLLYGYAAFAFARELTALPAVFRLSRDE